MGINTLCRPLAATALLLASPAWGASVGDAAAELAASAGGTGTALRAAELLRLALGLPIIQRASEPSPGTFDPENDAFHALVSSDGRYVAFLVSGVGGFVRDFDMGFTDSFGVSYDDADNVSVIPSRISSDGRFVAFDSFAPVLVPDDTNGFEDVFVRDRLMALTERVSVNSAGEQGEGGPSGVSDMTPDGRYVAFLSEATNLVPDDTNGWTDVFLRDRWMGTTERLTIAFNGGQTDFPSGPVFLSDDGRYAAFLSVATNLVPDDGDVRRDVFVRDRQAGTTERVNLSPEGEEADADAKRVAFSGDGRFVAYASPASNLVPGDANGARDIFVYDRALGVTERVSVGSSGEEGNGDSTAPAISADGRFVAFVSAATNLVPGGTLRPQVFVHDRATGETAVVSINPLGDMDRSAAGPESFLTVSADGRWIAFSSIDGIFASGDTDLNRTDVFRAPNPLFWDAPAPVPSLDVN